MFDPLLMQNTEKYALHIPKYCVFTQKIAWKSPKCFTHTEQTTKHNLVKFSCECHAVNYWYCQKHLTTIFLNLVPFILILNANTTKGAQELWWAPEPTATVAERKVWCLNCTLQGSWCEPTWTHPPLLLGTSFSPDLKEPTLYRIRNTGTERVIPNTCIMKCFTLDIQCFPARFRQIGQAAVRCEALQDIFPPD